MKVRDPMDAFSDDDRFERVLTDALSARPEHSLPSDLAQRAMKLAAKHPVSLFEVSALPTETLARLARLRRRNRLVAVAASLMIGLLVAFGASRVVNGGYLNDALGLSTTDASSSSTSSTASSTSISVGVVLTGEALLIGVLLLAFAGWTQRPQSNPGVELAMW